MLKKLLLFDGTLLVEFVADALQVDLKSSGRGLCIRHWLVIDGQRVAGRCAVTVVVGCWIIENKVAELGWFWVPLLVVRIAVRCLSCLLLNFSHIHVNQ